MIDWYIDSDIKSKSYLDAVNRNVEPIMEYICSELNTAEIVDKDLIINLIDNLAILKYRIDKDSNDFYFTYNKSTDIRFNDRLNSILRELKLNKLFK